MTPQSRIRRMGWLAVLSLCLVLYGMLHFKVNAVHSDVVRAERQIVALEEQNIMLETEFLTRSSQVRLAAWNRVDFGYIAPTAAQYIESDRQLASFGGPRAASAPAPIVLAGLSGEEDIPEFPRLLSPITGEALDEALVVPVAPQGGRLAVSVAQGPLRVPLTAVAGDALP